MEILIIKKAQKQIIELKKNNHKQAVKIVDVIYKIGKNPYIIGTKKLTAYEEYRYRIGDYRILYRIDIKNRIVTIVAVRHRKDVYK